MAGEPMGEIALKLGFTSAQAVSKAINDEIRTEARRLDSESRTDLLTLELDRLNYMLTKVWPQIEFGDFKAIESALKIIAMRVKLLGLDMPDASTGASSTVLVVGGAEADYIRALQSAS